MVGRCKGKKWGKENESEGSGKGKVKETRDGKGGQIVEITLYSAMILIVKAVTK